MNSVKFVRNFCTKKSTSNISFINDYIKLFNQSGVLEQIMPRDFKQAKFLQSVFKNDFDIRTADLDNINKGILNPLHDLLDRGGKRWRPVMNMLVAEVNGRDIRKFEENKDIYYVSALGEIIHNASLIQDDIEDKSISRRNQPCTYLKFGVDIALNSSVFAYYLPIIYASQYVPKDKIEGLFAIYSHDLLLIHIGQNWDISWHNGGYFPTEDQYLQMVAHKTGVMPRLMTKMTAHLLGLEKGKADRFTEFAASVGVAFQIKDDILSLTSQQLAEKKELFGEDIFEGKRTLMVIHANKHSRKRERLIEILNMHTQDPSLIAEAIQIITDAGSIDYAFNRGNEIIGSAWDNIDKDIEPSEAKDRLRGLVGYLMERDY